MLEIETRDGIALLRLRHGKVSALDAELAEGLERALGELEASDDHAAVVLTGSGGSFSAGVDLFRVLEGGEAYVAAFPPAFRRMLERMFLFPKPLVAAVNGHAIAGGFVLACACDHRIMARGPGRVGIPELLVGIPFPALALEIVRSATPAHRFRELVYGGATRDAEAALERGMVEELAEPEALLERAVAVARRYAAVPAPTFRITKRQLRRPVEDRLGPPPWEVEEEVLSAWRSPESLEAIRRYLERTLGKSRREA